MSTSKVLLLVTALMLLLPSSSIAQEGEAAILPTPTVTETGVEYSSRIGGDLDIRISTTPSGRTRVEAYFVRGERPAFVVDSGMEAGALREVLTIRDQPACSFEDRDGQIKILDCPLSSEQVRRFVKTPAVQASSELLMAIFLSHASWETTSHREVAVRVATGLTTAVVRTEELAKLLEGREGSKQG